MLWIIFALGAALAWGLYGPALHRGQVALGSPMRALLCVGVAYFLIGVLVPLAWLSAQGELNGFTMKGSMAATLGGALGAIGAVCIIFAFRAGGLPAKDCAKSFALRRLRAGCSRGWDGSVFQAVGLTPLCRSTVRCHEVSTTSR